MPPSIRFYQVSKLYHKGPRVTPTLGEWVNLLLSRQPAKQQSVFYALKNVSFSVQPGQAVGFIGSNGAGKSTILKLISKVTYPSEGGVVINGKVTGLLELGAGFHHELTGRENIFFNAAILGMNKAEIKAKEKSIIAFSELEEFIDTPVKYYSSGMYARLGFSIAIHIDPDILLIDEVLSVGDAAFQKKCFERIGTIFRNPKKTVIFVSHNLDYLQRLCSEVIWLDKGSIKARGEPNRIIKQYLAKSQ